MLAKSNRALTENCVHVNLIILGSFPNIYMLQKPLILLVAYCVLVFIFFSNVNNNITKTGAQNTK